MAVLILAVRPGCFLIYVVFINQAMNPGLINMIRWRSHWHVARQSWAFFQNDFAGRIANRVMQTGPAVQLVVVTVADAAWYLMVFGVSAIAVLARQDWWLAVPVLLWFIGYGLVLRAFVPRLARRSQAVAEARSLLTGRVVDSYTNVLTVKLFARARDEDTFVRDAVDGHTAAFRTLTRGLSGMTGTLAVINALLLAGTTAVSLWLWSRGRIDVAAVATALPLAFQCTSAAGWVARAVFSIFENIGAVQDGMRSLAVPQHQPDAPARGRSVSAQAASGSSGSISATAPNAACCTPSTSTSDRASASASSGRPAPARSTLVNLLLGFFTPMAAAS